MVMVNVMLFVGVPIALLVVGFALYNMNNK